MSLTVNTASLREWFRSCPAILAANRFRVDFLNESPTEYALYATPSTLRYHENIIGEEVLDEIQVQNFILASKEPYGADVNQNLRNLTFYNDVMTWITEQNINRNFPTWEGGEVKSILPTLTPYVSQYGSNVAKYQIQLRIKYRRTS